MSDTEAGAPEPEDQSADASAADAPQRPRPAVAGTDAEQGAGQSAGPVPGPVSATSRARRIGGRPVVPAAPTPAPGTRRPGPTSPAAGSSRPAPTPSRPTKDATPPALSKAPKAPKPAKQPRLDAGPNARLLWVPAGVLGAAALVLIVLIAVAAHGVYYAKDGVSSGSRNKFQQEALAAAKTCIASINTYDYRKIPQAEATALACTTGKFTAQLKNVYETSIKVKAPPAKVTQTAQVNQAGIKDVSLDARQVDVLTFGQLTVTDVSTGTTPQFQPFGAILTMQKVGSQWLVAKVSADVGGAGGS